MKCHFQLVQEPLKLSGRQLDLLLKSPESLFHHQHKCLRSQCLKDDLVILWVSLKEELHNKLEEFASHTDSLEEIHENKEQIEISRAYEKMPNPSIIATQEFLEGKVYYRNNDDDLFR